jgi:hypothetical protein
MRAPTRLIVTAIFGAVALIWLRMIPSLAQAPRRLASAAHNVTIDAYANSQHREQTDGLKKNADGPLSRALPQPERAPGYRRYRLPRPVAP